MKPEPQATRVYEFGGYRLDVAERMLTRDGEPVTLYPKVFDTLVVLVESGGEVLSKEELMERIWPGTFVQESNLTQNIFLLRKILGEDAIDTVPRRGYRFAPEVVPVDVREAIIATRSRFHVVDELESGRRRVENPSHMPRGVILILIAPFALLLGLIAYYLRTNAPAPLPRLEQLTHDSNAFDPAISPDGKLVAYRVLRGDTDTIWLRDMARGSTVQVMPPSTLGYTGLAFSRDGSELLFVGRRAGVKNKLILRVPIFGGEPQEVAREVWSDFAVAPNGNDVAFLREHDVVVAHIDGSGERVVGHSSSVNALALWDSAPSWSPDGKRLAVCGVRHEPAGDRAALFELSIADGVLREIKTPRWAHTNQVAWLPDDAALLVNAQEGGGSPSQIWLVDYPSGSARRVTNDVSDYGKMRLTADGRALVVERLESDSHIWLAHDGDASLTKQLTSGANDSDGVYGVSWMPNGRLLFASNRTGEYEIWSMRPDGSDAQQLTTGSRAPNASPSATPDGRTIVFRSERGGRSHIWRMDADGRNLRELTHGASDFTPAISPDGRWVYYTDNGVTPPNIARVSIDGGTPVRLATTFAAVSPVVSPDGRTISFETFSEAIGWRNGLMPAGGGAPRLFDWHSYHGVVRWMPDARSVVYVHGGVLNLWQQPLDGSAPRQITNFTDGRIWTFDVSRDGRDFAVVGGKTFSDVVRISDFR